MIMIGSVTTGPPPFHAFGGFKAGETISRSDGLADFENPWTETSINETNVCGLSLPKKRFPSGINGA